MSIRSDTFFFLFYTARCHRAYGTALHTHAHNHYARSACIVLLSLFSSSERMCFLAARPVRLARVIHDRCFFRSPNRRVSFAPHVSRINSSYLGVYGTPETRPRFRRSVRHGRRAKRVGILRARAKYEGRVTRERTTTTAVT